MNAKYTTSTINSKTRAVLRERTIYYFVFIACTILYGCSSINKAINNAIMDIEKEEVILVGSPIPLLRTVYSLEQDIITFTEDLSYSQPGDLRGSRWEIQQESFTFSFPTKADRKPIQPAFEEKVAVAGEKSEGPTFALSLSWRNTNVSIQHQVKSTKRRTERDHQVIPKNLYDISITGELLYRFVDPNSDEIISGVAIGQGRAQGGQFMLGSTVEDVKLAFKRVYGSAIGAAMEVAASKLVNILRRSPEIAAAVQSVREKQTLPADLIVETPSYSDEHAIIPNNSIDASEESEIHFTLANHGKGTAFAVAIATESEYKNIEFPKLIPVGDLEPGASRTVRIPLAANAAVMDGTATFTVQAKERRGHHSRKVQLPISVRHLIKPDLSITDVTINDQTQGRARGNGNGIIESGETVELTAYVRNKGAGIARNVRLHLQSVTSGIQIIEKESKIGDLLPNQASKGQIVIDVPRTFSATALAYTLVADDVRGAEASSANRRFTHSVNRRAPKLAYDVHVYDQNRDQRIENGESVELEIVLRNEGTLPAQNVRLAITSTDVQLSKTSLDVGNVPAGESGLPQRVSFVVPRNYAKNSLNFDVRFAQEDFPSETHDVVLDVDIIQPQLDLVYRVREANNNGVIEQGEAVELDIQLLNQGRLLADSVRISLSTDKRGVVLQDRETTVGMIPPNDATDPRTFHFTVQRSVEPGPLALVATVTQADFPPVTTVIELEVEEEAPLVVDVTPTQPPVLQPPPPGINYPPVVTIIYPEDGQELSEENVKLSAVADDVDGIRSVEVRVNGQPIAGGRGFKRKRSLDDKRVEIEHTLGLAVGDNTISVIAFDEEGERTEKTIHVHRVSREAKMWALVIGISEYEDASINLDYAATDAEAFSGFLRSEKGGPIPEGQISLLLNERATQREILKGFDAFLKKAQEEDVVIIYFAAHGAIDEDGSDLYFLAYDSDPDALFSTAISRSIINRALETKIRAKKIVMFFDACHAGGMGLSESVTLRNIRAQETNRLMSEISKSKDGIAIFSASSSAQFSQESEKWGGGVFTHFLLRGLHGEADENGDGKVLVRELGEYVRRRVHDATDGAQSPRLIGTYDGEMPLSILR